MMNSLRCVPRLLLLVALSVTSTRCARSSQEKRPSDEVSRYGQLNRPENAPKTPPLAPREFRAAWVATVGNIDWPSRKGLPAEQQQREIIAILDRAAELNLNAIILQVRTSADALYQSDLEPWSEFLTGTQGQDPGYDPLQMWIDESHRRGIELHAWFNPFRAMYGGGKVEERSGDHLYNTRPDLVKKYGNMLWLDPGEPEAEAHTVNVFLDVVRRYDVDGVHIDDYFYPYPVRANPQDESDRSEAPFPDDPSYAKYQQAGGTLGRDDWRRANIDRMIKDIYEGIKQTKPHVRFGISPFGIWKPDYPPVVKGFNQYAKLYADARLWLNEGWLDYWTPQLYWKPSAAAQPYEALLQWWIDENTEGRNVYPGLFTSKVGRAANAWDPPEILNQISITRETPGAEGHVHFSMRALMDNREGIADALRDGPYRRPALVPRSPWLDDKAPPAPRGVAMAALPDRPPTSRPTTQLANLTEPATQPATATAPSAESDDPATTPATSATRRGRRRSTTGPTTAGATAALDAAPAFTRLQPQTGMRVSWQPARRGEQAWQWAVYAQHGRHWRLHVIPGHQREAVIHDDPALGPVVAVAVSAVDRLGNESKRANAKVAKR
jgi:uncharacterized lipoprotein YddW (UPF0748 family)